MSNEWLNKIHQGYAEGLIPQLPDRSIDLVLTSPPYNIDLGNNKYNNHKYDVYQDDVDYEDYIAWLSTVFCLLKSKMVTGGRVCINIGDKQNGKIPTHSDIIQFMTKDLHYLMKTSIIWEKRQIGNRCLLHDELLNAENGYKKICDINVKDKVFTHKGRYKYVTNVLNRKYTGWLYTIYSYGNEPLMITQGHELQVAPLIRRYNGYPKKRVSPNLVWVPPENLTTEYYLTLPIYHTQYHGSDKAFSNRLYKITKVDINYNNEGFFRLLGYYIGDGSIHRNEIRFDFHKAEQFYINDVQKTSSYYGWATRLEYQGNCTRVVVTSKNDLPKILEALAGRYAHTKNMHPFIKQLPIQLQKQIVIGMMRSDGCIQNDIETSYTTVSNVITYQLRDMLLRLKIIPSITVRYNHISYIDGREVICKKAYILRIIGKYAKIMADICQVNSVSKAKYRYNRYKKIGSHYAFFKVKNIERKWVTDLNVYNIEVEEDQSYTGKVSYHNCSWGSYRSPINPSFPTPFEYILIFCNESQQKKGDKRNITVSKKDFIRNSLASWSLATEIKMNRVHRHPAMFPIELPRRLIQQLSYKNDVVLDIFSGMGTTCLAAAMSNRQWIGFELSEDYVTRSRERIQRYYDQERLFQ